MINRIKEILEVLSNNIGKYFVCADKYTFSEEISISFKYYNLKYYIYMRENKLNLSISQDYIGTIGSNYKISIPDEELQEIKTLFEIIYNKCINYTKEKFNEINF